MKEMRRWGLFFCCSVDIVFYGKMVLEMELGLWWWFEQKQQCMNLGGEIMDVVLTVMLCLGLALLIDKIYSKINLERYSPIYEYMCKAFLYGVIAVFTLQYGKESLSDVSPLEWAVIFVSVIEGTGNYISYVKESKNKKVIAKKVASSSSEK